MALSAGLFLGLLGAVAAQRLAELWRSRRHLRALADAGRAPLREPAVYPAMVAVHAAVLLGAAAEVLLLGRPFVPSLGAVALGVFVLCQLGRAWVLATLGGAWSVRVVAPTAVVTDGPYRFVRHPNYLIVCVELLALPLVHAAWLTALLGSAANALVLWRRIALEEAVLARDPAWVRAFAETPRLLPGRRRRKPSS